MPIILTKASDGPIGHVLNPETGVLTILGMIVLFLIVLLVSSTVAGLVCRQVWKFRNGEISLRECLGFKDEKWHAHNKAVAARASDCYTSSTITKDEQQGSDE